MTEHTLKTWPEYFQAVRDGSKPFELRLDDRGYAVGDILNLQEYDPMAPGYTGETERVRVTYVLRGGEWLAPGYVAMGVENPRIAILVEQLGILRDVARGVGVEAIGYTGDIALISTVALKRLREVAG